MKIMILTLSAIAIIAVTLFLSLEYWSFRTPNIKIPPNATSSEKLAAIHRWLDALEHKGKFNGTVLFSRGSNIVFQRNIGYADASGEHPISDRTSFNLASVTKHMTAFGILMLAYERKLSRSDAIADYLPELAHYKGVTLNHLLYHTSGIPDYTRLSRKRNGKHDLFTSSLLMSWLDEDDAGLHFTPGEEEEYSNTNYVLLAEIIARVSGMSFAEFMENRVFEPLNMQGTAVVNLIENTDRLDDRAYGFRKNFWHFGRNVPHDLNYLDGTAGDGNVYSTACDLLKWDAALRKGTLLPVDYYAQAYTPHRLNNGEISEVSWWGTTIQSGLGWNVQDMPAINSYGAWQGFSNYYRRDLEHDTVLIVLSNSGFFLRTAFIAEKLTKVADQL